MLCELLHFAKLERREIIILKDLGKFKVVKQKIAICKSGLGGPHDDFPTWPSMPCPLFYSFTTVTKLHSPATRELRLPSFQQSYFLNPKLGHVL